MPYGRDASSSDFLNRAGLITLIRGPFDSLCTPSLLSLGPTDEKVSWKGATDRFFFCSIARSG